jgi:hypothetical protein
MTPTLTAKASELEFISRIRRDGSGADPIPEQHLSFLLKWDESYELRHLSLTEGTFIAFNMSVYIVKLKP